MRSELPQPFTQDQDREWLMSKEQGFGLTRTALAFGSGYLLAKGLIDHSTLDAVISAVTTLSVAFWSVWEKVRREE